MWHLVATGIYEQHKLELGYLKKQKEKRKRRVEREWRTAEGRRRIRPEYTVGNSQRINKKLHQKIGKPICNFNILVTNPKEEESLTCLRFSYGRTKFSG